MPNKDQYIHIKGAKVHNLKNININIPRDKFVVITGVSGSGKSSLAFDTIYAEGQRRYVESLSSYARQFLGKINKPDVELIQGIPPAIAIEQKVNTRNPRSTVGTSTEVYDYFKLLFARIGKTFSPISNKIVQRHSVTDVVNYITSFNENSKLLILAPFTPNNGKSFEEYLKMLHNEGISRIEQNFEIFKISDLLENSSSINKKDSFNRVVDRIKVETNEDSLSRFADSVQIAFSEGKGYCIIKAFGEPNTCETFSNKFEADGIEFEDPTVHTFSFNNPVGACPRCEGYGKIIGIDEDLVIPNKGLSVYEEAIACWRGEKMQEWKNKLVYNADKFDFPIHKPFFDLSDDQKQLLWTGNKHFWGLNTFFEHLEEQKYKIQYRVMLSRYRGKTTCPDCRGTRLKKEASYIKIDNKSLQDLVLLPIDELQLFFKDLTLTDFEKDVSKRILIEINSRLDFLMNVGLGYLTLNRLSSTLSGGESQRINLATSLGSSLVGSLYILDEPSIGLHSRDNNQLISVLKHLQRIGNTVIVVEHDEDIIKSADEIIDIGPFAGRLGGEIIFHGNREQLIKDKNSLTAKYLTGRKFINIPKERRKWNNFIEVTEARENNLKNINVKFPLNVLTVVTGVSGSGKSTLVKNILSPALSKILLGTGEKTGKFDKLQGDINQLENIEFVDQNPIGKSSRSNPVTYLKAYDEIRKLYANQQLSKINNFKASHYSFNIDGGRCEECQGEGVIKVEMQFMADVTLICDHCHGKRFKEEILDVKYRNNNIFNILEMTVNEAIEFFNEGIGSTEKKIVSKLSPLAEVGLGYIKLGQSSSTLSGGESQRVKLASFLSKENSKQSTLFIFDEPTTGLHFHDIKKLLEAFNALISRGNSVLIIEHNLEIIKSGDWIIDLGPEGGKYGGSIVFEGTPEELIKCRESYTGKYLKEKLFA
ncbi:MAG: excinuclease ABC subunit UvrA [Bacteroidales bacterium]|jgi:excinuclease ABC subunit A|nr:excinuclease ABC subunit UvrA [Bacteroidales bacterium]